MRTSLTITACLLMTITATRAGAEHNRGANGQGQGQGQGQQQGGGFNGSMAMGAGGGMGYGGGMGFGGGGGKTDYEKFKDSKAKEYGKEISKAMQEETKAFASTTEKSSAATMQTIEKLGKITDDQKYAEQAAAMAKGLETPKDFIGKRGDEMVKALEENTKTRMEWYKANAIKLGGGPAADPTRQPAADAEQVAKTPTVADELSAFKSARGGSRSGGIGMAMRRQPTGSVKTPAAAGAGRGIMEPALIYNNPLKSR